MMGTDSLKILERGQVHKDGFVVSMIAMPGGIAIEWTA